MRASRAEIKIETILKENGIDFVEEYVFPELTSENGRVLRFDFAILDENGLPECLIEYQGKQHYEMSPKFGKQSFYRQLHNDEKKRKFCRNHGIKLVEIPYTEENLLSYDYLYKKIYDD